MCPTSTVPGYERLDRPALDCGHKPRPGTKPQASSKSRGTYLWSLFRFAHSLSGTEPSKSSGSNLSARATDSNIGGLTVGAPIGAVLHQLGFPCFLGIEYLLCKTSPRQLGCLIEELTTFGWDSPRFG